MPRVKVNTPAPGFTLEDFRGNEIKLSDFNTEKHVVLVFNRGFT